MGWSLHKLYFGMRVDLVTPCVCPRFCFCHDFVLDVVRPQPVVDDLQYADVSGQRGNTQGTGGGGGTQSLSCVPRPREEAPDESGV